MGTRNKTSVELLTDISDKLSGICDNLSQLNDTMKGIAVDIKSQRKAIVDIPDKITLSLQTMTKELSQEMVIVSDKIAHMSKQ